jgi:hypothetical protein
MHISVSAKGYSRADLQLAAVKQDAGITSRLCSFCKHQPCTTSGNFNPSWTLHQPANGLSTHQLCSSAIQSPDQDLQQGKFYFKDGSTYEGQYKVTGLAPPAVDAAPAKKGLKKKEEELLAQPAEPPKPVRHGVGEELTALLMSCSPLLQLNAVQNGLICAVKVGLCL